MTTAQIAGVTEYVDHAEHCIAPTGQELHSPKLVDEQLFIEAWMAAGEGIGIDLATALVAEVERRLHIRDPHPTSLHRVKAANGPAMIRECDTDYLLFVARTVSDLVQNVAEVYANGAAEMLWKRDICDEMYGDR